MALENLVGSDKYLSALVRTNPDGDLDPKSEGDDHLRGIKNALLNTFPNINGPVTMTPLQLNNAGAQKLHIGQVGMFIWAVNIVGWEVLDGHSIAVATYPDFFAVTGLTSPYTLPDVRGLFLRALDLSKGIDVGRALLNVQGDVFKSHTHNLKASNSTSGGGSFPPNTANAAGTQFVSEATGDVTETRPKNMALYPAVWCGMHT
jgi:microcystin-dependent protein